MKTNKPSRVLVVFLALVLAFSTGVIVLADDAYGMQGAKRKLQMIQPADLIVDSSSDTEYVNTLNVPVELTDGKASFRFKMEVFGGQITGADDKVTAMQNKVTDVVTITDIDGNAVSGSTIKVTAVDATAFTFDLDVSGLSDNTSYVLTFPSSFTTGGSNWALGSTIKFNFTTPASAKGTKANPWVRSDKSVDGTDRYCLALIQVDDENGSNPRVYNERTNNKEYYQIAAGSSEKLYFKVAYANGDEIKEGDYFYTGGNNKLVQANNIAVYASSSPRMKINGSENHGGASTALLLPVNNVFCVEAPDSVPNTERLYSTVLNVVLSDGQGNNSSTSYFATKTGFFIFDSGVIGNPVNPVDIRDVEIAEISDQYYTGEAVEPEISLVYNGQPLVKGQDYTVEYQNNVEIGEAAVTITGIVNKTQKSLPAQTDAYQDITGFEGSVKKTFNIVEAPVIHTHTEEAIAGTPATCTKPGLTEGKKCSVCGEWILEQEEIPAKGHTEEVVKGKAATCTEVGLTDGKKCSVCDEWIVKQEEIPALGHKEADPVKENEVAATCSKEGSYDEVVYCSECKTELSREKKTVDKLSHTEEVVKGKAATCTENGLTDGKKCSVCGEILEEQKEIPALGHDYEVIPEVISTCTAKGSTAGARCTRCGEYLVKPKEVPMINHTYKDGKCTVCGAVDPDYKPTPEEPEDTNLVVKTVDGKQIAVRGTKSTTKAEDYTGIAPDVNNRKVWWRVVDGDVVPNATGVFKNEYGWWRVENGTVNFEAQGIYKNSYGWWKTTDGKVTFDETGVFQNEYGWWRVEKSKVNFKADGIYKNAYGWWKTTGGKVTFQENGVFKNEYGWWKVEKSKVNFKFTGIAKNDYGTWYVKNGKVDFSKNGTVTYAGKAYTVTNGKAKLA